MKLCQRCGCELDESAEVCPACMTVASIVRDLRHMNGEIRCPDCNKPLRKAGIDQYLCPNCGEGWNVTPQ